MLDWLAWVVLIISIIIGTFLILSAGSVIGAIWSWIGDKLDIHIND